MYICTYILVYICTPMCNYKEELCSLYLHYFTCNEITEIKYFYLALTLKIILNGMCLSLLKYLFYQF